MDNSHWRERHYGTVLAEPPITHHEVGALSFNRQAGALRTLCYQGIECVRGIQPVIRDDQWGTQGLATVTEHVISHPVSLQLIHEFKTGERALSGRFEAHISACAVEVSLTLTAVRTLATCRSGLIVLLPLDGVVGRPVQITHSDDTEKASRFPELISPGQPFFDIKRLGYTPLHGPAVRLSFRGEVFEMEDQRNWSDASFKIYSRPLARPTPYVIDAGETVVQELSLHIPESDHDARCRSPVPACPACRSPLAADRLRAVAGSRSRVFSRRALSQGPAAASSGRCAGCGPAGGPCTP